MKKIITISLLFAMALTSVCFADTYVHGYQRSDGTYVESHHRSDPDGIADNNWSHAGNTNPYTGARGYNR